MGDTIPSLLKHAAKIAAAHRVTRGGKFRLKDHDPENTGGLPPDSEEAAKDAIREAVDRIAALQERLYAENKTGVVILLQAMDAAGKDGVVKHVMSGVNPQGCVVTSFKQPSSDEANHDFLWRCSKALPARGMIGIFNRSYYEETLVVRVHPGLLAGEHLKDKTIGDGFWKHRFKSIRHFEDHLVAGGYVVLKFFLNVSKEQQQRRLLRRLDDPERHWKFSAADVVERGFWDDYRHAYDQTIRHTATKTAPWYVVPADHKWYTRYVVTAAILDALETLAPKFPTLSAAEKRKLGEARRKLMSENG